MWQIFFHSSLKIFLYCVQAAGWIIPMSWLISNERVRDYGCDSVRAAAEYFQKGCAPGIRDRDYMLSRWGNT